MSVSERLTDILNIQPLIQLDYNEDIDVVILVLPVKLHRFYKSLGTKSNKGLSREVQNVLNADMLRKGVYNE